MEEVEGEEEEVVMVVVGGGCRVGRNMLWQ